MGYLKVFNNNDGDQVKPLDQRILELLRKRGYFAQKTPTNLAGIKGEVPPDVFAEVASEASGYPLINPVKEPPDPAAIDLVPKSFLKQGKALPYKIQGGRVLVLISDPTDDVLMRAIRSMVSRPVTYAIAPADALRSLALKSLERDGGSGGGEEPVASPIITTAPETPQEAELQGASLTLNRIIDTAIVQRATDIHFEWVTRTQARVRVRVDGRLFVLEEIDPDLMPAITNVIKMRAGMDSAQRFIPQDGRFQYRSSDGEVASELRASVVPTVLGESAVLRILPREGVVPKLDELGYEPHIKEKLLKVVSLAQGLFLVTGPTGSGKTTTLFALINEILVRRNPKILSVEDPVEYRLPGVNQVQVSPQLSFARALRAFLRQDPDVILVGEMRDGESAKIAVEAAMTGHLVLGTLHTNTAIQAIVRLEEMGVEKYKALESTKGILAQRLVPKLCPTCKVPSPEETDYLQNEYSNKMGIAFKAYTKGPGCPDCSRRGYKGRVAIHEFLWMTPPVKKLLLNEAPSEEVVAVARREGYRTLFEDGLYKVASGIISYKDLLYATELDAE